jgi:hypothetical protein
VLNIFPDSVEIRLTFRCPTCNSAYVFHQEEICQSGMEWYCGCGTEMLCRKKEGVYNENYMDAFSPSLDDALILPKRNMGIVLDCLKIITDMGFDRKVVQNQIEEFWDSGCTSKEDIIRGVLSRMAV